jgi:hypothetical protein
MTVVMQKGHLICVMSSARAGRTDRTMNRATEPTSQNKNALGDQSAYTGRRLGRYRYAQELAYALRQHPFLTIMTDHAGRPTRRVRHPDR